MFSTPSTSAEVSAAQRWASHFRSNVAHKHSAFVSSITICRCTDYTGDQCTSVFSTANILTPVGDSINVTDTAIQTYLAGLRSSSAITEACLNQVRIARCLSVYTPCNGSAWCAPVSQTSLSTALLRACDCDGPTCTLWDIPTISNYYKGSSSTGPVGSAMLTCQDVTVGKRWHLHWHPSCVG